MADPVDPRVTFRKEVRAYLLSLGLSNKGVDALVKQVGSQKARVVGNLARAALERSGWVRGAPRLTNAAAFGRAQGFLEELARSSHAVQRQFLVVDCGARPGISDSDIARAVAVAPTVVGSFNRAQPQPELRQD